MPSITAPLTLNILSITAATSIAFIVNWQSPLSGARPSGPCDPAARAPARLFAAAPPIPSPRGFNETLRPCAAFLVGFPFRSAPLRAPSLALNLMFEALFLIHERPPGLARSPSVRSALLFFAEALEHSDRSHDTTKLFDHSFLGNPFELSQSIKIAQITHRSHDSVRALFDCTEATNMFQKSSKCDESLYFGQIVANISDQHGVPDHALSVLSFLVNRSLPPPSKPMDRLAQTMRVVRIPQMNVKAKGSIAPAVNDRIDSEQHFHGDEIILS
jgi:hypothetical protein